MKIGQEFNYTLTIQTNKTIGKSQIITYLDGSADGIKVEWRESSDDSISTTCLFRSGSL